MDFAGYQALSFDCYGTLIDWETGILAVLRPWAARYSLDLTDDELLAAHGRHETKVQQEAPGAAYPAVLEETMRRIGRDLGAPVAQETAAAYGAAVEAWPAFADSTEALQLLKRSYKLIILSNVDRGSFAESNRRLGVDFDLIVTAEDVGSYKPDLQGFFHMFTMLDTIDVDRGRLLHVAESIYHDHVPAAAVALDSVWINRRNGREGYGATATPETPVTPLASFPSLAEFAVRAVG